MLPNRSVVVYRPLFLIPQESLLLGLIWIAVQRNRERGGFLGAVPIPWLENLIFTAQSRGLIDPPARFRFDYSLLPDLGSAGIRLLLDNLARKGFLHVSETEDAVGFLGMSFYELPTEVFRHVLVFGLAALVEKSPGGENGR